MRRLLLLSACLAALGIAAGAGATVVRVAWVNDGDTIVLSNRALLQIDTPEVGSGECYSRAAARELRRLLPVGSTCASRPTRASTASTATAGCSATSTAAV